MQAPLKRQAAPPPPGRRWLTVLKWLGIAALVGVALMAATIAFVFWMYGRDPNLPNIQKLSDYRPKQVTTILDTNDRRIGELGERRTFVPYDKIPPIVVDAFIAAEDNNFWTHAGVDYTGMARAFFANLRAGHTKEGASTITQQVVKNFLLTNERTFKRKIQEIILARRLEHALTKQDIMTLYLNQIYFGGRRYGVQEAARFYFGKDISQVNVGEAAVLASMPKEPEVLYHSLRGKNPAKIKDRQTYVLNQMVKLGMIKQPEAQKYIDAPIQVVKDPFPELGRAPGWVDLVKKELVRIGTVHDETAIDDLGAKVRTTLDPGMQASAQKALQAGLRAYDKRKHVGRPVRTLKGDKIDLELAKLTKKLPAQGPKLGEEYEAIVTAVHDDDQELEVDLGHWPAGLVLGTEEDERYNPDNQKPSERFKPGDVVNVVLAGAPAKKPSTDDDDDDDKPEDKQAKHQKHLVKFAPGPQGAVVIIEVKTRKVRALVGGYSPRAGGFNRATMAKRQPGSSFKPFVYAAAIDSGKFTAASTVNDAPEVFDLWKPKNYEGKFEGPVLLRHALARSINTVSIRLTSDITPDAIVAFAHKMGIVSELPKEMSIALGSGVVTPLEMTNAICTLAAGGVAMVPRFVETVNGKPVDAPPGEQVLRPEVAYVVTDMMRSVVTEGTGHIVADLKIPIAGKTGTSNDERDAWFIGMTPDYTIGVWVGYDDNRTLGRHEQGGVTAAPIYRDIMKDLKPTAKAFPRPAHVVEATIDRATGLLAPEGAPKETTLQEVFVEGSQPTETAPQPGEVTEGSSVTGEYGD